MAATWPASLPKEPQQDETLRIAPRDNLVRSQTDTGPGKTRRRSSRAPIDVACSLVLNDASKSAFQAFFREDLLDGALRFTWAGMDALIDGAAHEYQFAAPPAYTPLGTVWRAELQLTAW